MPRVTVAAHARLGRSRRVGEPRAARGDGCRRRVRGRARRLRARRGRRGARGGRERRRHRRRPDRRRGGGTQRRLPARRRRAVPPRRGRGVGRGAGGRHLRGVARRARPAGRRARARSSGASARSGSRRPTRRSRTARASSPRCGATASRRAPPTARRRRACSSPATARSSRSSAAGCSPRRALERGARLYCDTPAVALAGDRVATPAGEVACKAVVVCVDGWLERLLPELAGRRARRGCRCSPPRRSTPGTIPCPVYDNWGYDYWQQLPDGSVALGGGRGRYGDAEWGRPAEAGADVQALARPAAARARRRRRAPVTHRWAGVIAYTEDRLPVLRRGPAGRARRRRALRPRQRARLGGGPRRDGDRARRRRAAARAAPAARALGAERGPTAAERLPFTIGRPLA